MYFDLNVPVPPPASLRQTAGQVSKKKKGKQPAAQLQSQSIVYSPEQIATLESRVDVLERLGYTVLAFNQTVISKVDPRSHVNTLDPLLKQLRKREGILYLKRLTIELDEDSEKGNGLSTGNVSLFTGYDILALLPKTRTSLSNTCLMHSQPSPLTTHIISIPLTEPRLPFRLKHTLVRTAIKNGAVFEINYFGALGENDDRRNWWAATHELARVTKGKGLIISGGVEDNQYLRAPRDVGNLITLVGIAQNLAHDAATTTPKSLLLRAQTRKTYRAVLSVPTLVSPSGRPASTLEVTNGESAAATLPAGSETRSQVDGVESVTGRATNRVAAQREPESESRRIQSNGTKRAFEALNDSVLPNDGSPNDGSEKKRKKKNRARTAETNAP